MKDVTVKIEGLSGTGKTWLAVNLRAYLEQRGFVVQPLTEGRNEDRFVIREPVPVITQVMAGRQLYTALANKEGRKQQEFLSGRIVRLPGVVHQVEINCEVVYDTETPPIKADHVSTGAEWLKHGHVDFNKEYLQQPKEDDHPDCISVTSVTSGMRGFFAVYLKWCPDHGGFYEPFNTSAETYRTRSAAVIGAKEWAAAEGVIYK